jgi:hypothetical protein
LEDAARCILQFPFTIEVVALGGKTSTIQIAFALILHSIVHW